MVNRRIYFFTGSGNSYATARDLGLRLGETELVSITALLHREEITDDTPLIGFVFPIYGGQPPKVIREWLIRFRPGRDSVCFAVCTCGIAPGNCHPTLDKILRTWGSGLTWGFSVKQPQSGIGSKHINTPEEVDRRLAAQRIKIEEISRHIASGGPPVKEKSGPLSEFLSRQTLKVLPTLGKLIAHLVTRGMKGMIFHAGQGCKGCGICQRLCPAGNIALDEGKAVWGIWDEEGPQPSYYLTSPGTIDGPCQLCGTLPGGDLAREAVGYALQGMGQDGVETEMALVVVFGIITAVGLLFLIRFLMFMKS